MQYSFDNQTWHSFKSVGEVIVHMNKEYQDEVFISNGKHLFLNNGTLVTERPEVKIVAEVAERKVSPLTLEEKKKLLSGRLTPIKRYSGLQEFVANSGLKKETAEKLWNLYQKVTRQKKEQAQIARSVSTDYSVEEIEWAKSPISGSGMIDARGKLRASRKFHFRQWCRYNNWHYKGLAEMQDVYRMFKLEVGPDILVR